MRLAQVSAPSPLAWLGVVIFVALPVNNGCTTDPHCYVIRALLVFFIKQACIMVGCDDRNNVCAKCSMLRFTKFACVGLLLQSLFRIIFLTSTVYINKIQRDATVCRCLFTAKLIYMFRVSIAPIIRSTSDCNCSLWYRS